MKIQTARALFYLGTTLSVDFDALTDSQVAAAIDADALTLIGEVENPGEWGGEYQITEGVAISDDRVQKDKTAKRAASGNMIVFCDPADVGQQALVAAYRDSGKYNLKMVADDQPAGSDSTPTRFYGRALITSARVLPGTIQDYIRMNVGLEMVYDVVQRPKVTV